MSTTTAAAPPPAELPEWAHCGEGSDPDRDPVGCRGVQVTGFARCLAHLDAEQRATHLATLAPGSPVDYRATAFTKALLAELLDVMRDPTTNKPTFGTAGFIGAQFNGTAGFIGAQFNGTAWFTRAQFNGTAEFEKTQFSKTAGFNMAQFNGNAWFTGAQIDGGAGFNMAQFDGNAGFNGAQFNGGAGFTRAQFSKTVMFIGTQFSETAWFDEAQFTGTHTLGPFVCRQHVVLTGAIFALPVTVQIAAAAITCTRIRWSSTATLRIRHAAVDLTDAVLDAPIAVTSHPTPFTFTYGVVTELDETTLDQHQAPVRVSSIRGVDASNLVLSDVDLSQCAFTGAFHLDHLRLEGDITFAQPPTHHRAGWPLRRWSRRRTLAEEHRWRARQPRFGLGWNPAPDAAPVPGPGSLAVTYRALRKALEDRGDAPGAADFYYGEMDMRRHDHTATRAERGLLTAYWMLSGYGLRASRALGSLLIVMAVTVFTLVLFGMPAAAPEPVTTGVVAPGGRIVLSTITPPMVGPPWGERVTGQRVGEAIPVVLNAVIFRSSDDSLTTAGVYLDMAARLLEPSLLALAVLAVRGRVKR